MGVVQSLWQRRELCATLDLLAEDVSEPEQVERNLAAYMQMVDAAADSGLPEQGRPTLSLKPSSYTCNPLHRDGDAAGSLEAMTAIAEYSRQRGVGLSIDMEGREWTDFTLDALRRLRAAGHDHVGCVLQTRLHRTEADLAALPDGVRVRLVIGIYQEPESVALTSKPEMKERLLTYAEQLLKAGHYVEFATHDEPYVRRFIDDVVPRCGVGPDRFEVQMLYGVPRDRLLAELRRRGVRCRLYVPFALSWAMAIQYLRRRLDEYPAMMWYVTKNMFSSGRS